MCNLFRFFCLFPLVFVALYSLAQDQSRLISFLTVEEGLSQNDVTGILKDSKGFMWFATRGGLNRYDGYEFVQHKSRVNKENYLSNPSLECIHEDRNGNLWIGTESGGLNFYDYSKERFLHISRFGKSNQTIKDKRIISINQSLDGNILLGTWSDGLYILDFHNDTLLHPITDNRIYKIVVEDENIVWLGTKQGLIKYNLKTQKLDELYFGDGIEVTDMASVQNSDELWLVGWKNGLKKVNKKSLEWVSYDLRGNNSGEGIKNDTYSLLHDRNNKLWIGTWGEGIYKDSPMKAALQKYLEEEDTPERRLSFVYDTYKKFISTINAAIKKYDPNHLNLGLRFGGNPPDEIIKASSDIGFDVFSLNIYGYETYADRLERIDNFTGLPIIIGEFHFGTPGRGLAPGLAQTLNQQERGVAYQYYVENAAAHHSVVGTHWFQWWDQPSTGRYDGENYNIGFVSVADVPYRELVEAAKATHRRIKDIHSGKLKPTSQKAKVQ